MIRPIIEIDEDKCDGCGLCANACHEGALVIVNGKAKLLREDYCDGLGDCLPSCPRGAISFVEREVAAFDPEAVAEHLKQKAQQTEASPKSPCANSSKTCANEGKAAGCPGLQARRLTSPQIKSSVQISHSSESAAPSQLSQWPIQIRLAPIQAPYYHRAKLLIAADCSAFAYARFHEDFIKGRICLIGCPRLDPVDYSEKIGAIISQNDIRDISIVRMEVPCCGGLETGVIKALKNSGKMLPWQLITLSSSGEILD